MGQQEVKRYKDFPAFFRSLFKERVQKLSIDGGFTCPNRDGTVGAGGCVYCNNKSFSPDYCRAVTGISQQISEGIRFFDAKYKGQKYLAYFQAYSNTYAPIEVLQAKYQEALAHPNVVGLVIGTRPDTVDDRILDYMEELAKEHYICVEYGVESTNGEVLRKINRGHDFATAEQAIRKSAGRGITIGAHLIFGLPGETRESMLGGAVRLSRLPVDVLKFHQLQIIKDTLLADQYLQDPLQFKLYTMDEYLDLLVDVIERINPETYLERFVNQSPDEYLIAPKWGIKNFEFTDKLDKRLKERGTWQGKAYK